MEKMKTNAESQLNKLEARKIELDSAINTKFTVATRVRANYTLDQMFVPKKLFLHRYNILGKFEN